MKESDLQSNSQTHAQTTTREAVASGLMTLVTDEIHLVHHVPARKKRKRRSAVMQLQMTSMIDVIFLLLIYFVITAAFVENEGVLSTKLPEVGIAENSAPELSLTSEMRIELDVSDTDPADVLVTLEGQVIADFASLYTTLVSLQDDPELGRHGLFGPEDPVRIVPVGQVRWQHVVNTLNAAIHAGYHNVQFVPAEGG